MQLSAITVNWNRLENLQYHGTLDNALWDAEQKVLLGDPPWPSDSCVQLSEMSECYDAIKDSVPEPTRSLADTIMNTLLQQSFEFPWELKNFGREGHIIGAISPSSVAEYLKTFSQISYGELDDAFDSQMPPETRERCQIAAYPSNDVFTGYLRQWEELFKYASRHNAGVLLHCG